MIDIETEYETKEFDINIDGGTFHVKSYFNTENTNKSMAEAMTTLLELMA